MSNQSLLPIFESLSRENIFFWVWVVCGIFFLGHWLVASYHWYTFGSTRSVSLVSIIIYGVAGLAVLISMGTILLFI